MLAKKIQQNIYYDQIVLSLETEIGNIFKISVICHLDRIIEKNQRIVLIYVNQSILNIKCPFIIKIKEYFYSYTR